eukprot:9181076-Pyramimonas_sp.AAC.1
MDILPEHPDFQWRAQLDLPWHARAIPWLWTDFLSAKQRVQYPPAHRVPLQPALDPVTSMKDYAPAPAEAATPTLGNKLQHRTPKFWVATAGVLTLHPNVWDGLQDSTGPGPGRLMQLATQFSAQ